MVHNPISLKNICDEKLKKYTYCQNLLDVMIVAHILKLLSKSNRVYMDKQIKWDIKIQLDKLRKRESKLFQKVCRDDAWGTWLQNRK